MEHSRLMSLLCNWVHRVVSGACRSVLMSSAGTAHGVADGAMNSLLFILPLYCSLWPLHVTSWIRSMWNIFPDFATQKNSVSVGVEMHLLCNLSLTLAFTSLIKLYFFFPFLLSSFVPWRLKFDIVVGIKALGEFGANCVVIRVGRRKQNYCSNFLWQTLHFISVSPSWLDVALFIYLFIFLTSLHITNCIALRWIIGFGIILENVLFYM